MKTNHCILRTTPLRYDGRSLALINSLCKSFDNDTIYILNLDRKKYEINFDNKNIYNYTYKLISFYLPETRFTRVLESIEYSLLTFIKLLIIKPRTVIICHEAVMLSGFLYSIFFRKTTLIYDDRELYHPKDKNINKLIYNIEISLIKKASLVIFTNKERERAIKLITKNFIKKYFVFENLVQLPHLQELPCDIISKINSLKIKNIKILLHQSEISERRGRSNIIKVINKLPEDWVLAFIGVDDNDFNNLLSEIDLDKSQRIENLGYIPYNLLYSLWNQIDAGLIFYDSNTFNNKYCAPNRLYLALDLGKPIIVNSDNYTLSNCIKKYNNGISISTTSDIDEFFTNFSQFNKNANYLVNKFHTPPFIKEFNDFLMSSSIKS